MPEGICVESVATSVLDNDIIEMVDAGTDTDDLTILTGSINSEPKIANPVIDADNVEYIIVCILHEFMCVFPLRR